MKRYGSSHDNSGWIIVGYAILVLVVLCIGFGRGIFADKNVAIRALESQGYSNIEIVDHVWFAVGLRGCDPNDAARFTARATNPVGKSVEIDVCAGTFFKGGTIRVR